MPIISTEATKKAKAIAYAGGYELKNDNPHSRIQVSSSVLYKHWRSGNKPKIYRKLISGYRGTNAVYSLTRSKQFKTYEETL